MLSEAGLWMCWFLVSWEELWFKPMLDAAYDLPWATCLDQQSDPEFVAASAGPGCAQE